MNLQLIQFELLFICFLVILVVLLWIVALYSLLILLLHYLDCYCLFILCLYILIFYWLSTSQISLPVLSVVSYMKQKLLNLMSSITPFSSLWSMLFSPTSRKKYIPSLLQKNSLTLFYNNCLVLSFTFRALFQWESFLVLCYSIVWVSFLFFLQIFCQFS